MTSSYSIGTPEQYSVAAWFSYPCIILPFVSVPKSEMKSHKNVPLLLLGFAITNNIAISTSWAEHVTHKQIGRNNTTFRAVVGELPDRLKVTLS